MTVTSGTPPAEEDTRARILQVALELFAERGFAATSTRELSERLGFTKAALYYHFRTKDDLLEALVQPVINELTELITQTPIRASSTARRGVLEAQIDIVAAHLDLLRMLIQDPSVAHRNHAGTLKPLQTRMLHLLAGTSTPDAIERSRARAALGALHGALLHAEEDDDPAVLRAVTLAAACAALGIPGPRRHPNEQTGPAAP